MYVFINVTLRDKIAKGRYSKIDLDIGIQTVKENIYRENALSKTLRSIYTYAVNKTIARFSVLLMPSTGDATELFFLNTSL